MKIPAWQLALLGQPPLFEGDDASIDGQAFTVKDGMLRSKALLSDAQKQTEETFGFKWRKRDTFESDHSLKRVLDWLVERYGAVDSLSWLTAEDGTKPLVLDAGCGAAMSGLEYFGHVLDRIHYLGVDVSEAVDVARTRFSERGLKGSFMQADIVNLPLPRESIDVIFSEGVLHHTNSTEGAIKALAPLIKPGGLFMFYVYKKKGPIREFSDDYIRDRLQEMSMQGAWDAMMPLTKLGQVLGDLDIEIEVPEAIGLLDIPAGKINLQRLFYWHVFKAFHRPDMTLDEMNHINYDWYAPANAHRQTPQQVRAWCDEAALDVERERVEDAGITVVARKRS